MAPPRGLPVLGLAQWCGVVLAALLALTVGVVGGAPRAAWWFA